MRVLDHTRTLCSDYLYGRRLRRRLRCLPIDAGMFRSAAGRRVVFNTVRSGPSALDLHTNLFLGHCLARCGVHSTLLLDDGILRHWDSVQRSSGASLAPYRQGRRARLKLHARLKLLLTAYAHPNLDVLLYSTALRDRSARREELREQDYDDAKASVMRYFEDGTVDLDDAAQHEYFELCLENCRVSRALGVVVVEQLQPDLFLTSHGFYSTWGGCYDVVRRNGTNTGLYAFHPYRAGHLILRDQLGPDSTQPSFAAFTDRELDPRTRSAAADILHARTNRAYGDTATLFSQFGDSFRDVERSEVGGAGTVFAAFPNVAWDAMVARLRGSVFGNLLDWLGYTVEQFRGSRHNLVIRFHPSETSILKGTRRLRTLLRHRIPDLERLPNVHLIAPDDNVDSYQLSRSVADVALVFDGTLGSELPHLGIPVIAAAEGRFPREAVYQPTSRDEYAAWLRDPSNLLADFDATLPSRRAAIESFIAYLYFEAAVRVPILSTTHLRSLDYEELSRAVCLDSEQAELRRTIAKLLERVVGEPQLADVPPGHPSRPPAR